MDREGIRYHSVFGDRANTPCICEGRESAVMDPLQVDVGPNEEQARRRDSG